MRAVLLFTDTVLDSTRTVNVDDSTRLVHTLNKVLK